MFIKRFLLVRNLALATTVCGALTSYACATDEDNQPDPCGQILPTNQRIAPTAAPDAVVNELRPKLPEAPSYTAGGAMSTVMSPDGKTLLWPRLEKKQSNAAAECRARKSQATTTDQNSEGQARVVR